MAYPKARGENPLNYDEYDPTPFSGGYDQVAFYGRPKSPSNETCYPISESTHQETGGYGADYSSKPSRPKYGVDEHRPSFQDENPPHGSDDFVSSGYGGSKPQHSSYGGGESGAGYGRTKPSSYEDEGGYGGHKPSSYGEEGEGGYGGPKPSSYAEEGEGGYSGPKPSSYAEEGEGGYGSGYGGPKPSYGEGGFGSGHGRPKPPYEEGVQEYGQVEESGYGRRPGFGGPGFGRPHGEGFGEKLSHEDDRFGSGGRRPGQFEGEGGFGGPPPRFGGEEGGFGGEEGGFGGRRPVGFGGEDRPSYFGDERPPPPADEVFGGNQGEERRHGHHHKHHWSHDDE